MDSGKRESGLLTIAEAGEFLRLKSSTIRSWVLKRKIPFVKLGSRVFLRHEDCERLIQDGLRSEESKLQVIEGGKVNPHFCLDLEDGLKLEELLKQVEAHARCGLRDPLAVGKLLEDMYILTSRRGYFLRCIKNRFSPSLLSGYQAYRLRLAYLKNNKDIWFKR